MHNFDEIYKKLNPAQRRAVDTIDGPLLVLAGPGTGKTQLLSARVANILRQTDTLPGSILCLTFTEAAALNMRDRLSSMIGEAAYDVHINTYHGFASDIIKSNSEYFENIDLETGQDSRMERPIDDITQLEVIKDIVYKLPYGNPLYNAKHYLKSVASVISDFKQAAMSPAEVKSVASENLAASGKLSPAINDMLSGIGRMPSKAAQAIEIFSQVESCLTDNKSDLAELALAELIMALQTAADDNSTKPITKWKNDWLQKNDQDEWTFANPEHAAKLLALADVYESYQRALAKAGQYDFNDMIIRTIETLKDKPELKFNLQEKYQYFLLDEFQDTNAAQFELVKQLVDHPVHEGRPNIMAVGDDDQGIFAFQGADIGNMVAFINTFRDTETINLTQNYRSHHDILHVAHKVADQIESRLHHGLAGVTKTIEAAASDLPENATIARHEFESQASEYGWIADKISELIAAGTKPDQIAVLSPKHAILEALVPFLNTKSIAVAYEKREDVFETPIVRGILLFCELLQAGAKQNMTKVDELLPKLLSLDYWQIDTAQIWQLNWDYYSKKFEEYQPWAKLALANPATAQPVEFILHLASIVDTLPLEQTLDYITGAKPLQLGASDEFTSPLKQYYFSQAAATSAPLSFYETISHLSVIRSHLRDQQAQTDKRLTIENLLDLYQTYQEAEQPLLNTHPIAQAESAVQLQTVYKAKGLEYEYVFLPSMHDDVWGSAASSGGNKISLPANLKQIKHDASTEDTRRRLLFVAVTRAKHGLFTTSFASKENGKKTLPAKYYLESQQDGQRVSQILPAGVNTVIKTERPGEQIRRDVDILWHSRHVLLTPTLKSLLTDRLERYVMSPTHLNTFTNLEYAGPQSFLLNTLLRFPEAQSADSLYGDALHNSLEWWQKQGVMGERPSITDVIKRFTLRLQRTYLSEADKQALITRGTTALKSYLGANGERLKANAKAEVDFRKEGVTLDGAVLTGKIDRLEIDEKAKTVWIIDFKSGTPATKWSSESKYLNYKQQLYFYILLLEKSQTYKDYTVAGAALEFIEPLGDGKPAQPLVLKFDQKEYDQFKKLVVSVWKHIISLNLPEVAEYTESATGTRKFIEDLTSGKI